MDESSIMDDLSELKRKRAEEKVKESSTIISTEDRNIG
jgi:hypothetical protein